MSQEVNISVQQVQNAAAAGVALLADPTIRVPMGLAMGQLAILNTVLNALASGKLILTNPPVVGGTEDPPNGT